MILGAWFDDTEFWIRLFITNLAVVIVCWFMDNTSLKYVVIIGALSLTSCTHKSELKTEPGVVIEKHYFPDTRQTATGVGVGHNGSVVITTTDIGEDEKYIVIFKCYHDDIFAISRKNLYRTLNVGDKVGISYYENLTSDNTVTSFEFVNAEKK